MVEWPSASLFWYEVVLHSQFTQIKMEPLT
jgi:hypothetical protein